MASRQQPESAALTPQPIGLPQSGMEGGLPQAYYRQLLHPVLSECIMYRWSAEERRHSQDETVRPMRQQEGPTSFDGVNPEQPYKGIIG